MKSAVIRDTIGGTVSSLCIAHCIVLPVLAIWSPALVLWAENEIIHQALIIMTLFVSAPLLIWEGNQHTRYLGILGLASLILALFLPHEIAEKSVTSLGSGLIILGHIFRYRACKSSSHKVLAQA